MAEARRPAFFATSPIVRSVGMMTLSLSLRQVNEGRSAGPSGLAAGRGNDAVHAQVFDHLTVMIVRMRYRIDGEAQARSLPRSFGAGDRFHQSVFGNAGHRAVEIREGAF